MQTYEAMRQSILHYHQFPWWNPWISGGVPLFANPQFGLISIQTFFVLLFGTFLGYKIALISYFIIGFWGIKKLFINNFNTPTLTAILLSYIWTFGTFLTQRTSGHHTFLLIQFFPWALHFYFNRFEDRKAWLKLGLVLSFMGLSAAHNITVMSYVILGLIFLLQLIGLQPRKKGELFAFSFGIKKSELLFWAKVSALFIAITGYRLFFTIKYLSDFPRSPLLIDAEPSIGIINGVLAIFGPLIQFTHSPKVQAWSWLEASSYISIFTLPVFILTLVQLVKSRRVLSKTFAYSPYILLTLITLFFLLGLGRFIGPLSPYEIMHKLPVLSSMRVSYRWLAWCSLFILIFIASYRGTKYRRAINILLALATIELFFYSSPYLGKPYSIPMNQTRSTYASFEQRSLYQTKRLGIPYDENLTDATRNNYGQIIAGDALVDTRYPAPWGDPTIRCSIDTGCDYVITKNATVDYWSPNKIILKRTQPGIIKLDMNPGRGWVINGKYVFLNMKTVDPEQEFIITDESNIITIVYRPHLSIDWVLNKIR
jgi:hypothetical protein